jgi:hypothetical protein
MNFLKRIFAAALSAAVCLSGNSVAAAVSPETGNTESSTYIIVLVVAGILIIGAVVAGIITKKKK